MVASPARRRDVTTRESLLAGLACVLGACGGSAAPVPAGTQLGPALAAALAAADQARTPWRCAAADGPALAAETLGAWTLADHTLARTGGGEITIAAIADAGGAAPATMAALGRLRAKLQSADLVLALGGMGTTQAELEATLGALADKAPLVALPGDLEDAGALGRAVATLRAKGLVVLDGRRVHRVEMAGATVGIVAGASAAGRLVAGAEGCAYAPAAAAAIVADLTARSGLRILASAEAPREERAGEPTGELAITVGAGQEVDVALHGPMAEGVTRARSGGRDGNAVPLTPGTLDATARLPDPARSPTAGLLVVRADGWSWKPVTDAQ